MKTTKSIQRGIRWIVEIEVDEGIPTQHQIFQDFDHALFCMCVLYTHREAIAPGLVDRNGDRYSKQGAGKKGGDRKKGATAEQHWVKCRALSVIEENKLV